MTPPSSTPGPSTLPGDGPVLKTLLISDLVDSTQRVRELGDRSAAGLFRRHDRLARDLMERFGAREIDKTDGFLLLFERPLDAVLYALDYHRNLRQLSEDDERPLEARVGIHLAEVLLLENRPEDIARGAKPLEVEGLAKPVCARLMGVASAGQTLLTRAAFDVARRGALDIDGYAELRWLAHGGYHLKGMDEAVDLFEVGEDGHAPLEPPEDSEKARRVDRQAEIAGWRPAPGLVIPQRTKWRLLDRLGAGGFGEVWLAEHLKTKDQRVFKFCYDAVTLRSLQREITLLRLLKEKLGQRTDMVRVLDWEFDSPPYSIEMEYCSGGSLLDWATRGGLDDMPLEARLDMVAQVAEALAAAHSIGILHKDVKPGNILVDQPGIEGAGPAVRLGDFGIGQLTEKERLDEVGITALGLTLASVEGLPSGTSGTRLYMAPEVLEGKMPTLRADIYSLGVVLFQMVVGDFGRVLAPGWRRDIDDPLLADDIAAAVDGSPERRLGDALELASRLRRLPERRRELAQREARQREEEALRQAAERYRRRRRIWSFGIIAALLLAAFTGFMAWEIHQQAQRANLEAEAANRVTQFLSDLFEAANPRAVVEPGTPLGRDAPVGRLLDLGAERLQDELVEQPALRARLLGTLGEVYVQAGDYASAGPLLEEAVDLNRRLLERGEISVESHPQIVAAQRDLAFQRGEVGQQDEARQLFEDVLTLDRTSGHAESLGQTLHDVGIFYYNAGDYEEAAELIDESLQVRRQALGPEHALVGSSLHGLAMVRQAQGDLEGAEEVMEESIDISRDALGDRHAKTVQSLANLGLIRQMRGDYQGAAEIVEETWQANREILGEAHPSTFGSLNNLAILRLLQGELETAEPLTRQALDVAREVHGDEHPTVATILNNLGFLLHGLQRWDEAEDVYRQSLNMRLRLLGPENDTVATSYNNLARLLWARGEPSACEPMAGQAVDLFEKTLPPEHWRIANARSLLGGCLLDLGRVEAAEPLLSETYDAILATGATSPYSREARLRLVRLYEALGDEAKAAQYRTL